MAATEGTRQGPKTLPWQPEFPSVTVQQSDANAWEGDLLAILVPEEAFKTDEGADFFNFATLTLLPWNDHT